MIPVTYVDLSAEEEAIVLASLDPLAAMATTDAAKLRELPGNVTVDSEVLAAMLAALAPAEPKDGLTDPDDVPEPPDEATTRPGDLWLLGEHRLLCGDAGSPADLDRLLEGTMVDLFLTDPPCNVRVEPRHQRRLEPAEVVAYPRSLPSLWTDSGPEGRRFRHGVVRQARSGGVPEDELRTHARCGGTRARRGPTGHIHARRTWVWSGREG